MDPPVDAKETFMVYVSDCDAVPPVCICYLIGCQCAGEIVLLEQVGGPEDGQVSSGEEYVYAMVEAGLKEGDTYGVQLVVTLLGRLCGDGSGEVRGVMRQSKWVNLWMEVVKWYKGHLITSVLLRTIPQLLQPWIGGDGMVVAAAGADEYFMVEVFYPWLDQWFLHEYRDWIRQPLYCSGLDMCLKGEVKWPWMDLVVECMVDLHMVNYETQWYYAERLVQVLEVCDGKVQGQDLIAQVIALSKHKNSEMRIWMAGLISKLPIQYVPYHSVVPQLLQDPDVDVVLAMMDNLPDINHLMNDSDQLWPVIESFVLDKRWRVRAAAAKVMDWWYPKCVQSLGVLLNDCVYAVRMDACQCVKRMSTKDISGILKNVSGRTKKELIKAGVVSGV
jgi:hypothetical protein